MFSLPKRQILFTIVFFLFSILFFRFYSIQIVNFDSHSIQSEKNSLRKVIHTAPRGIIYDTNLIPLVDNRPNYGLSVIPYDVSKEFNYFLFEDITGLNSEEVKNRVNKAKNKFSRFKPLLLKQHLDFKMRSLIEENKLQFPGISFTEFPARTYPNSANLTHALGYLRKVGDDILSDSSTELNYKYGDVFGFNGLEHIYENVLRGKDGVEFRLVDIYGIDHGKYNTNRQYDIKMGDSLILAIDSRLQIKAESLLNGKKGAIICMKPNNGEILTFVSAPDYDLSSFIGPIPHELWNSWNDNPEKPLINRGIQGTYPPGSIVKLISAGFAIDSNIIDDSWTINCKGSYSYGDRVFNCWNMEGHGEVNATKSIILSCNIFYYHLIQKIGFENWSRIHSLFGFGRITDIDLPGEKKGILPTKAYMNEKYTSRGWGKGSLLNFVIGQGDMLATPQQVIQIINLISTSGLGHQPHLRKDILTSSFNLPFKKSTWKFLKEATFKVVNDSDGTGKNANSDFGEVYGKTGTAQNPHGDDHSWFSGFIDLPTGDIMSLVVIVENGGKGSQTSAYIAKELFDEYAKLKK